MHRGTTPVHPFPRGKRPQQVRHESFMLILRHANGCIRRSLRLDQRSVRSSRAMFGKGFPRPFPPAGLSDRGCCHPQGYFQNLLSLSKPFGIGSIIRHAGHLLQYGNGKLPYHFSLFAEQHYIGRIVIKQSTGYRMGAINSEVFQQACG